jgi:glycosyltransferase involved in cell wall biosynthesis
MKIFVYADHPEAASGNGGVARNILQGLHDAGHEIEMLGIGFADSYYDQKRFPYKIHFINPLISGNDLYGEKQLRIMLEKLEFDIFLYLGDIGVIDKYTDQILKLRDKKKFKFVMLTMLDYAQIASEEIDSLRVADRVVVCSKFSYDRLVEIDVKLKDKLRWTYWGVDEHFFVATKAEKEDWRKRFFDIKDDDTYLILNVARNQWRKDIGRSIAIYREFHKLYPNSKYFINAKQGDMGGHLPSQAFHLGVTPEDGLMFAKEDFDEWTGYSIEQLNQIYNCANVGLSTNLGEGFGFFTAECFATGLLIVNPDNTTNTELVGKNEERGYLMPCGVNSSEWLIPYGTSNYPRPFVNVEQGLNKLVQAYKERDKPSYQNKVNLGLEWAKNHTWSKQVAEIVFNIIN